MELSVYRNSFLSFLEENTKFTEPKSLYEPVSYILQLGGKRMRPLLALMSVDAFGKDYKLGLHAALAIEVFHNFTLLHDDIMDGAPLRRGKATVHEKWDVNTAILSGDAMMILANQCLEVYEGDIYKKLMQLFQKTALEVCEGQQYDMDFENRNDVSIPEYIEMIRLKTSVLVAAALKMGAIISDASEKDAEAMYQYGLNLGLAFQLQDDYLDAFGDPETFGKQVGGDIIENKKTFLYLKALENLEGSEKDQLLTLFTTTQENIDSKIEITKKIFIKSKAVNEIQQEIKNYTQKAFDVLEGVSISVSTKEDLIAFGHYLMGRKV
ncbi:polyprenyl synthetase family protein [Wenyingzhuangia marina]|uniref:Geranylgeranyl diphosphate synthase, type II n=1 Tax=Wenyingzhuangia marina TaxID=1195760 RepID=A0A1M5WVQ4_9FLAO|nr:polyprenyl synthetase family protein [Wenyingzhuangia marina]GGF82375.1 isoprenyl synthetase [Wenyingzhuangia marina]SHH91540.1 geranylgeranyl diphosphate synthase, type II [Wenyingzhuangia marina]